MFKNIKSVFIALIAITLMFGCKGPPRPPGFVSPSEAKASMKKTHEDAKAAHKAR